MSNSQPRANRQNTAPVPPAYVWVVHSPCDCDDAGCYGKTDLAVFFSEQTARQEADIRSKRYGGWSNSPHQHIDKIRVSAQVSRW